jgi:DNA-binding XRE family transcriptional regulator
MLEDKLRDLDIKKTELASYLNISRPTIYKFIESYDSGEYDTINKKILKLFDYITSNELIGKNNVINYILNNIADVKELESKEEIDMFKDVRRYILSNPNSEKSHFINLACQKTNYDLVIHYLVEITPLLKKRKLSTEEEEVLKPYKDIISKYTLNKHED